MKKLCGTCAFWLYMGFEGEYEDDEGDCARTCTKTKQDYVCDEHIIHAALLED